MSKTNVELLLSKAAERVTELEEQYTSALVNKEVSDEFRINVRYFFGDLRSVLDYLAFDIVQKYCPNAKAKDKLYFPICSERTRFEQYIGRFFPELKMNHREIYDILENFQPFKNFNNNWLIHFRNINNRDKHIELVPQNYAQGHTTTIIPGESSSSWDESKGPVFQFEDGVTFGPAVPKIPGTEIPLIYDKQCVQLEEWEEIRINNTSVSVISLVMSSLTGITSLYRELENKVYS